MSKSKSLSEIVMGELKFGFQLKGCELPEYQRRLWMPIKDNNYKTSYQQFDFASLNEVISFTERIISLAQALEKAEGVLSYYYDAKGFQDSMTKEALDEIQKLKKNTVDAEKQIQSAVKKVKSWPKWKVENTRLAFDKEDE